MALVNAPRVRAQINGSVVDSVMTTKVTAGASGKSSQFDLMASTSGGINRNPWLSSLSGKVAVKIMMNCWSTSDEVTMFEGLADNIAVDSINNQVHIQGRDYSSVLINSTYHESFCNQTSSEIAECIALRHGFIPIITTTSNLVGSYQCEDHNQVLLNAHSDLTNEWGLLRHLAIREGFELFVDGTALVFAPLESLRKNYRTIDPANTKELKFYRICPLSDETRLVVKSWNSWLGAVSLSAENQSPFQITSNSVGLDNNAGIEMAIVRPNLSQQGTQQMAQRYLEMLSDRALQVEITMPGDLTLRPRDILSIVGTGSNFDTDYIVRSIRRQFSSTTGFIQYIKGYASQSSVTFSY